MNVSEDVWMIWFKQPGVNIRRSCAVVCATAELKLFLCVGNSLKQVVYVTGPHFVLGVRFSHLSSQNPLPFRDPVFAEDVILSLGATAQRQQNKHWRAAEHFSSQLAALQAELETRNQFVDKLKNSLAVLQEDNRRLRREMEAALSRESRLQEKIDFLMADNARLAQRGETMADHGGDRGPKSDLGTAGPPVFDHLGPEQDLAEQDPEALRARRRELGSVSVRARLLQEGGVKPGVLHQQSLIETANWKASDIRAPARTPGPQEQVRKEADFGQVYAVHARSQSACIPGGLAVCAEQNASPPEIQALLYDVNEQEDSRAPAPSSRAPALGGTDERYLNGQPAEASKNFPTEEVAEELGGIIETVGGRAAPMQPSRGPIGTDAIPIHLKTPDLASERFMNGDLPEAALVSPSLPHFHQPFETGEDSVGKGRWRATKEDVDQFLHYLNDFTSSTAALIDKKASSSNQAGRR